MLHLDVTILIIKANSLSNMAEQIDIPSVPDTNVPITANDLETQP